MNVRTGQVPSLQQEERMPPTVANGKICYVEIPAHDPERSAAFYHDVFGWGIRRHGNGTLAFDDGVGEVSGMWVTHRPPMTSAGIVVSIMVDDIAATIAAVEAAGGRIVQPLGADAPELTAHFADPAGNVFGLYQERHRRGQGRPCPPAT
jgi:predicted enzyme related to lactoylglutathione lyase